MSVWAETFLSCFIDVVVSSFPVMPRIFRYVVTTDVDAYTSLLIVQKACSEFLERQPRTLLLSSSNNSHQGQHNINMSRYHYITPKIVCFPALILLNEMLSKLSKRLWMRQKNKVLFAALYSYHSRVSLFLSCSWSKRTWEERKYSYDDQEMFWVWSTGSFVLCCKRYSTPWRVRWTKVRL